jgi:3-dehydroquinate dehydratase / shikimate dehydrogenase
MSEPELCVTVTGATSEALRRAREAAEPDADLVELRLDFMPRPDPAAALEGRRRPVIVTCRPAREGGHFTGAESERLPVLREALALGAEYVDVEWDADSVELIRARRGRGVIVSRHLFDRSTADPHALIRDLRSTGAELVKLAVTVDSIADLARLAGAVGDAEPAIVIGMGDAGIATRVLAARFGSRWTYAGDAVAPGQIPAARLLHEFRFRRVRGDSAVYGLLGTPIARSLSPVMHNAGFAALGLNAVYVPFDTASLDGLRDLAAALDVRGLGVTIPFKQRVIPLLDELAPSAAAAGAVNTIAIRDERWIGLNTDIEGFLEPLHQRNLTLPGARAVILGAGGAARAVAVALRAQGAAVAISARRSDAGAVAARAAGVGHCAWPPPSASWDVLVNATPVGSRGVPGVAFEGILDGRVVYDLVYDPDPTELIRRAAHAGCQTIGGLDMLIAQAERQFEIWTGQRPPHGLFAAASRRAQELRHP